MGSAHTSTCYKLFLYIYTLWGRTVYTLWGRKYILYGVGKNFVQDHYECPSTALQTSELQTSFYLFHTFPLYRVGNASTLWGRIRFLTCYILPDESSTLYSTSNGC